MTTARVSLPAEITSFVGRRSEIASVRELVERDRLVTLLGPGGVGKTRLAAQVGADVAAGFSDGVWFIDLSLTRDPNLVPALVAEPFDVGDIGTGIARPLTDVLVDYFDEDRLLLILDNCEHVRTAASSLVDRLLRACPDISILTTTRQTLDLPGEIVYRVSPLGLRAAEGEPEAVQLFIDRMRLVDASRRPDDAELEAIAAIVDRLDGLPLAIELAASRTKLLSPLQILERLTDRFDFLTGGRGRPERQETLLATMEWSYELLDPADRDGLDRLAIFNGWTLEAAEAVIGADTSVLLERLLDSSLIEIDGRGPVRRYRMLETVRQYGTDRLEASGRGRHARSEHAGYYLALAERSDTELRSSEQSRWIDLMRPEHDNIRAALSWALDDNDPEMALRLTAATGRFWFMQTHWAEALAWLERATELAAGRFELLWARAFIKTGVIEAITQGMPGPEKARMAHGILVEQGTPSEVGIATYALAEARLDRSELLPLLEESARVLEEAGDAWSSAYVQRWQGSKVELVGDPSANVSHQRRAVAALKDLGDRWTAAWLAFDLGFSLVAAERLDEAREAFAEALDLVTGIDERLVEAHAHRGLGAVAAGLGRHSDAVRFYGASIPMFERIGDVSCLSFARMYLAEVEATIDPSTDRRPRLLEALAGFRSKGHDAGIAAVLRRLAQSAIDGGDGATAARLLGAAGVLHGGARKELSPLEAKTLGELQGMVQALLGPKATHELTTAGAHLDSDEVDALVTGLASVPEAAPGTDATPGAQDAARPQRAAWPAEHAALRAELARAWGLTDDIHIYRALGGKSGAAVLAVDVTTKSFSGQAILKLETGTWTTPAELESERHAQAWEDAPDFAEAHMPRVVLHGRWHDSSALVATIASSGLEYTVPFAEAAYDLQRRVGRVVARDLLFEWNRDYRLGAGIVSPQQLLAGWLGYRLEPERGRIFALLVGAGIDSLQPTLVHDGSWYPNPLAFALDDHGSYPGVRPVMGHLHGDLHGFNVLVRDRAGDPAWFLIDLAFYQGQVSLFYDHAYFEVAHLLANRENASLDGWMPLIASLETGAAVHADDQGLVELVWAMRDELWSWIEAEQPDRRAAMESQLLLARVAAGLNFAHKNIDPGLRQRGLLYAMTVLKDYLRFADIEWERSGPTLAF